MYKIIIILLINTIAEKLHSQSSVSDKFNGRLKIMIDSMTIEDHTNRFRADHYNYVMLSKIIKEFGYPDYGLVGKESSNNFWQLVQHQDMHVSFQDSVLILLKVAVDNGEASSRNYAYLVDRVKCNKGELQIYGTQVNWKEGNTSCEPKPAIEPEKLNERRKSVGLEPEEEYLEFMLKKFKKRYNKE